MIISSRSYGYFKIPYNPQQLTMTEALSFLKMRAVNFSETIAEWKIELQ